MSITILSSGLQTAVSAATTQTEVINAVLAAMTATIEAKFYLPGSPDTLRGTGSLAKPTADALTPRGLIWPALNSWALAANVQASKVVIYDQPGGTALFEITGVSFGSPWQPLARPDLQSIDVHANPSLPVGGGGGGAAPSITSGSSYLVIDGQTAVGTVTSTGEGPITYSLTGVDAAKFAITSSGVLSLLAAANSATQASYSINVIATGAIAPPATKALTISATGSNIFPIPALGAVGAKTAPSPLSQFMGTGGGFSGPTIVTPIQFTPVTA